MTDQTNLPAEAQQTAVQTNQDSAMSVGNMWASMVDLAKDPTIDAAKIGHLVGLQEQMIDRAAKDKFDRAFAAACQQMPTITKDDKIEHKGRFIGWFKKYEDLREIVDNILNPLGLTVTHDSDQIDGGKGGLTVWTVITYLDAEYTWREERGRMPIPPDAGGAKSAAQAVGSSLTYGQRYSLAAAFGIVQKGLDRDGRTDAPQLQQEDWQTEVKDGAQKAATRGSEAYTAFFSALSPMKKGWLVEFGGHAELKDAAASHD